jgi:hypothetical protein
MSPAAADSGCEGSSEETISAISRDSRLDRAKVPRNARVAKRVLSFDDLVGASDKRLRKYQTKFLGGLEVDDQVEFCRLLDRKIGRLRPLRMRST